MEKAVCYLKLKLKLVMANKNKNIGIFFAEICWSDQKKIKFKFFTVSLWLFHIYETK